MLAPNGTVCDIRVWLTEEWSRVWNMTLTRRRRSQISRRLKPIAPRLFPNNTKSDNSAVWSSRNWLKCNRQLNDAQAKSESSIGQVSQAEADVRTAELNLGYTLN